MLFQRTLFDRSCSKETADKLIMNYIINDLKPLCTVQSLAFRELIKGLSPSTEVMCSKTLAKKIESRIPVMILNIKKELKEIKHVCTTADIWTCRQRSYLGVTCHWIDPKEMIRHSVVLGIRRFKGAHTYDRIATLLVEMHSDYDLESAKITHIITDNGSNLLKPLKNLAK
jgi:tRNA G10  N-methylase Trm11